MVYCSSWEKVKLAMLEEWPRLLSNMLFRMIFFFENFSDMVQYLPEKFSNNFQYRFQEVDVKAFEEERAEDSLKVYDTVDGSSTFKVAVFTPNSETFKAAPFLCLCDSCLSKYGFCEMFIHTSLNCTQLKANFLWSQYQTELTEDTGHQHWPDHS